MPDPNLVFDIGVSDGTDTAFFLAKGFRVVAVEADPVAFGVLQGRFAGPIATGQLTLLNRAAADTSGEIVSFWRDDNQQSHSSLAPSANRSEVKVPTIAWPDLLVKAGAAPRMCKIDIEGSEPPFLSSMKDSVDLPTYISAEVQTFTPVEMFHRLGYRQFRLINQTIWHAIQLPDPPREGKLVPKPGTVNAWSGPFGRELPGEKWFSFDEVREQYVSLHKLWQLGTVLAGWLDCHAWNGRD